MDIAEYYQQQRRWRHWSAVYDALPALRGSAVLDLGCAVGEQAAELARRGASVTGVDMSEQVLAIARARQLPNARFLQGDLRTLPAELSRVDGVWSSFAVAYFPVLQPVLDDWVRRVRAGGWVALIEIDDLFAHHPLGANTRQYFDAYADDALAANRYDFRMGRRLAEHATRAGLRVDRSFDLPDDEFARDGPLAPDVVTAWQFRLDGMKLLRDFCGTAFPQVRDDFLHCLAHPNHRSTSHVRAILATKDATAPR